MTRHCTKQKEEAKWTGTVCPKIRKIVEKNVEYSNCFFVDGAGDGLFSVEDKDLQLQQVAKVWNACPHVLSCARLEKMDPLSLVDKCY
jgi:hypothetical protein